jgi:hypothetical protein
MPIEFRVQGKDSATVADEFADQLKVRFRVTPVVRKVTPPQDPAGGASGEKFAPASAAVFVVEVAVTAYQAYITSVQDPYERQVRHWMDLVHWARSKLPTTIRAVIGEETLLMHESAPERLHELTRAARLTREPWPPLVRPTDILEVGPLHREVIAELRWAYEQCARGAFNAYPGQYLAIVNQTVQAMGDPGRARDEAAGKTGVPPERVALFYVGGE